MVSKSFEIKSEKIIEKKTKMHFPLLFNAFLVNFGGKKYARDSRASYIILFQIKTFTEFLLIRRGDTVTITSLDHFSLVPSDSFLKVSN